MLRFASGNTVHKDARSAKNYLRPFAAMQLSYEIYQIKIKEDKRNLTPQANRQPACHTIGRWWNYSVYRATKGKAP